MMNRYVIYSALVGNYDEILQPLVEDNRFDYVLFTDAVVKDKVGVWQIRPIEYHNEDNTRICRYVKTHPEVLLSDYSVSVWIDSNVQIMDGFIYDRIIELDREGILFSSMWHPSRNCIYQEAFAVVYMMVEHERIVVDWSHYLRKKGYPKGNGLCETNVMFRRHNDPLVQETDRLWWDSIDRFSRRDQLSFNYSIWEKGIPCHFFLGEGNNARNTTHLRIVTHKDTIHNHCQIGKNEAWLMRHCWKKPEDTGKIANLYYCLCALPFSHIWVAIVGQYYRIKDRIK